MPKRCRFDVVSMSGFSQGRGRPDPPTRDPGECTGENGMHGEFNHKSVSKDEYLLFECARGIDIFLCLINFPEVIYNTIETPKQLL